jgi:hypothetical protein
VTLSGARRYQRHIFRVLVFPVAGQTAHPPRPGIPFRPAGERGSLEVTGAVPVGGGDKMIPAPDPEDEMILVNRHAFDAIIKGALSHAVHRVDSDNPTVETCDNSPPETLGLGLVAAEPKADEDPPIDPAIIAELMEAIEAIEARISACEEARNV